jgi:PST family polysaccharide transporter
MSTAADTMTIAPGAHRLRPDSLATSVAILLVVSIVQRSIGFGRGVLFCRWLTPEQLGSWEMAYSFLLLAAPIVVLGLPGSFGRYLERYRQRGQLRTFLRRTAIWTCSLTVVAVTAIALAAPQFSTIIFGEPDQRTLVLLLAASLATVILHHFLEALFAALRKFRVVSAMHFCQSTMFAVISLALLWWWRAAAESIVIGYGAACLVSITLTLLWMRGPLGELAAPDEAVSHASFWPPLVRFAIWVWVTNLLCQMFAVVDRYMLVHCSGLDNVTALGQVGNYHASRVVPLLLVSLAELLAAIVMPYVSHDWEAGRRQQVSDRLNLVLKLTSLGMFAASVAVLWAAPLLFHVAFQGRYDAGLAVLPWTLSYCVLYGLLIVAQNFIWCAERTKLGTLPLAIGLVANIGLNLVLLPVWGLYGAVVATTISTALAVAVLYLLNRQAGMQLQAGTIWLSAAPLALGAGPWLATALFVLLVIAVAFSRTLLSKSEREVLTGFVRSHAEQWAGWLGRRSEPDAEAVT